MKIGRIIFYLFLALFLVLLDVSFLSNFELYGATVVTSFLFLMILSITDKGEDYLFFGFTLVILFSIFSSLPILIIAINFLLLSVIINFLIKRYFRHPSSLTVLFYFLVATLVFESVLLVSAGEWTISGLLAVCYFVVLNTFFGWIGYLFFQKTKRKLLIGEIKI